MIYTGIIICNKPSLQYGIPVDVILRPCVSMNIKGTLIFLMKVLIIIESLIIAYCPIFSQDDIKSCWAVVWCVLLQISIMFLAATKQLYEWFSPSVRLSVRLSVCPSVTPFWLCSYQRIIMKFSGVITKDKSDVHAKDGGQRSKVKVTEVTTQLNRFRTVTPVWIHVWWWNDAYSLMMLRRGALLFLKVIRRISRSHGSKIRRIWPRLGVSGL